MSAVISNYIWHGNIYTKMSDTPPQLCRICMSSEGNLTSIFNTTEKCLKSLAEMLTECINYKISREDKLPKNICQTCIKQVRDAYALKEKAVESYRRLHQLYCEEEGDEAVEIKTNSYNASEKSIQTENIFDVNIFKTFDLTFQENHIEGNRYLCLFCEKSFVELADLKIHMMKGHTNVVPSIQLPCPICQRNFSRKDHLRRHLINVHKDDPNKYMTTMRGAKIEQSLECPICFRRLSRKDHLKRHISLIHQRDPNDVLVSSFVEKDITMSQEPFVFNEAGWNNDHSFTDNKSRNETGFMYIPAQHDSFAIKQEPNDIYNVLKENDINDDTEITKQSNLLLSGEGDISFKRKSSPWTNETPEERTCQLCQRVFSHLSHLRCHMESAHTQQKPHTCTYCSKSFAQKYDLDAHVRRHTGERYKCEQCDASFLQLYGLHQHALSAHGKTIESTNENLKKVDTLNSPTVTNVIPPHTLSQTNGSTDEQLFKSNPDDMLHISETENSFSHHAILPV